MSDLQSLFLALDAAPDDGRRLMILGAIADAAEDECHVDAAALRRLYDRRWLPHQYGPPVRKWQAYVYDNRNCASFLEMPENERVDIFDIHWGAGGPHLCNHRTLRGCLRHVLATLRRV